MSSTGPGYKQGYQQIGRSIRAERAEGARCQACNASCAAWFCEACGVNTYQNHYENHGYLAGDSAANAAREAQRRITRDVEREHVRAIYDWATRGQNGRVIKRKSSLSGVDEPIDSGLQRLRRKLEAGGYFVDLGHDFMNDVRAFKIGEELPFNAYPSAFRCTAKTALIEKNRKAYYLSLAAESEESIDHDENT